MTGVRNMSLGNAMDILAFPNIGENAKFPDACTFDPDPDDFCYNTTLRQCHNLCDETDGCKHANYCPDNSLCYLYPANLPLGPDTPMKDPTSRADDCFTTFRPSFCNYRKNVEYGKYFCSNSNCYVV
jgi:hypothetical protein